MQQCMMPWLAFSGCLLLRLCVQLSVIIQIKDDMKMQYWKFVERTVKHF